MAEPISITCPECDKPMKVPADLQGKKIKCKACEHIFLVKASRKKDDEDVIPILKEDAPKTAKGKKPAAKPAPKAGAKPAAKVDEDLDEDGKPYGMTETSLAPRCPDCANEMDEDAKICLFCGYNTTTRLKSTLVKTIEHTGGDWALWLTPGILCVLLIFLFLGIDIWYCTQIEGLVKDQWYEFVSHAGIKLWVVIISLFGIFLCGRFAVKRLILHPRPPEKFKK